MKKIITEPKKTPNVSSWDELDSDMSSSFRGNPNRKIGEDVIIPTLIILSAVLFRLVPHPPNFTPIAALAIFGGIYLDKKYAFIVPMVGLIISDLFLGFHSTMPYVYGSFIITIMIGLWLKSHKNAGFIVGGTLLSSVLFFVITNFGVWITGNMYSKDLTGLIEAYTLAIPFFRNTILGDIIYTGLFVGGYEVLHRLLQKKRFLFA